MQLLHLHYAAVVGFERYHAPHRCLSGPAHERVSSRPGLLHPILLSLSWTRDTSEM